jgi:hypothetical protein
MMTETLCQPTAACVPTADVQNALDALGVFVVTVRHIDQVCRIGLARWEHAYGANHTTRVVRNVQTKSAYTHAVYLVLAQNTYATPMNYEALEERRKQIQDHADNWLIATPHVIESIEDERDNDIPAITFAYTIDWGELKDRAKLEHDLQEKLTELQCANEALRVGTIGFVLTSTGLDGCLQITLQVGPKTWTNQRERAQKFFEAQLQPVRRIVAEVHQHHYRPSE